MKVARKMVRTGWKIKIAVTAILLLLGQCYGQQEVCVRATYPYASQYDVQTVLSVLQKKGVAAKECGKQDGALELWFYPMNVNITSGETDVFVHANPVPGGAVGSVSTYTPSYSSLVWTFSLHPDGGVWSDQRYFGYGLKSQAGKMGKWIRKHYKVHS